MKKIKLSYTFIAVILTLISTVIIIAKCEGVLSINGGGNNKKTTVDFSLERILKRGKLIVLAENSTASYFIYRGKKMGFEYEVLKQFANDLGVKLEVKVMKNLDNAEKELNEGKGDILACNYTITKERKNNIRFSHPFLRTCQVLVQRKPENWRSMKYKDWRDSVITDPVELAHKKVHVWQNSSYYKRLVSLMDEIGDTIYVIPEGGDIETEELIEEVADGEIDYTVVDKNVALINQRFYNNLDVSLELSVNQQIAFGLAKNNVELQRAINTWIDGFLSKTIYHFLRHKYFEISNFTSKSKDQYSSLGGKKISPYDAILKKESAKIKWDWRLVAAVIYQESKFIPDLESWAGAYGLMQFMPETGERFGVYPGSSAEVQIKGGVKYLNYIYKMWSKIPDTTERLKFALASYNAGPGHIIDAQRLAEKYGKNPNVWKDNVEFYMQKLSNSKYYNDEVVKNGTFRGVQTIHYVKDVFTRFIEYKTAFP